MQKTKTLAGLTVMFMVLAIGGFTWAMFIWPVEILQFIGTVALWGLLLFFIGAILVFVGFTLYDMWKWADGKWTTYFEYLERKNKEKEYHDKS